MRRFLVALGVLVALAGAVVGGVAVERTLLDEDDDDGISEAEHDRLVEACVAEGDRAAACVAYVAELVEWAEGEGIRYGELAGIMDDEFEQAEREEAERQQRQDRAAADADQRELDQLETFLETQAAQDCAERHGGPCDEATMARDDMAFLDCTTDTAAARGLAPGQVTGADMLACQQALDDGALVPRACRDDPGGDIAVADYGELIREGSVDE